MKKNEKEFLNKIDILGYAGFLGNEYEYKKHKLSKLIGYLHHPSIGAYKEKLLRKQLSSVLPSKYQVGTGFILYPNSETLYSNTSKYVPSHQIDIIIYNSQEYAPIFKDDDFVVLKPECVIAIIEVKGNLTNKDFDDTISKFISFSMIWENTRKIYLNRRGNMSVELKNPLQILFAWDRNPTAKGNEVTYKNACKKLCDSYKTLHNKYRFDNTKLKVPYFNSFYCYNDYIINQVPRDSSCNLPSYRAFCGSFEEEGKIFDRTIFDLTATILAAVHDYNPLYDILDFQNTSSQPLHTKYIKL